VFFKGSRYEQVPTLQYEDADGRIISYKALRDVPDVSAHAAHVVDEGERLDHIAFAHYREPDRFWRICDANIVVKPERLIARPGEILDIPPAEG
jgi:hypothetical protein